jgi:hypothetical protein
VVGIPLAAAMSGVNPARLILAEQLGRRAPALGSRNDMRAYYERPAEKLKPPRNVPSDPRIPQRFFSTAISTIVQ